MLLSHPINSRLHNIMYELWTASEEAYMPTLMTLFEVRIFSRAQKKFRGRLPWRAGQISEILGVVCVPYSFSTWATVEFHQDHSLHIVLNRMSVIMNLHFGNADLQPHFSAQYFIQFRLHLVDDYCLSVLLNNDNKVSTYVLASIYDNTGASRRLKCVGTIRRQVRPSEWN